MNEFHKTTHIFFVKYQVAVHGLFVERLLCVRWKLNMENISIEKAIFKNIMECFKDWKKEIEIIKKNEKGCVRIIDAYFISTTTHNNLLTLVRVFLGYAEALLLVSKEGELVPALHCNQSSIEGLFSCIRGMGKDRTDLYTSGVLQHNLNNNFKYN